MAIVALFIVCRAKKVDDMAQWLSDEGFNALPYHAGMDNTKRAKHQDQFLKQENIIIVANHCVWYGY